jgi:hypothetical protein
MMKAFMTKCGGDENCHVCDVVVMNLSCVRFGGDERAGPHLQDGRGRYEGVGEQPEARVMISLPLDSFQLYM